MPSSRREISIIGFPKCKIPALMRALETEPGVKALRNANGSFEIAPKRLKTLRRAAPECDVLAHSCPARIYQPDGIDALFRLNPRIVVALCCRNPAEVLISLHGMHREIARTGRNKNHFAYKERGFFAEADIGAYYEKYAREGLRYDHYLQKMLDRVPNNRMLVVLHEELATTTSGLTKAMAEFARDGVRRPVFVRPENKPHKRPAEQEGSGLAIPRDILDELDGVSLRMKRLLEGAGVLFPRSDIPMKLGKKTRRPRPVVAEKDGAVLIINNGVPKSGSTWVQRIICGLIDPAFPSDQWRNDWVNPSIPNRRFADYIASEAWKSAEAPSLIKMHFANSGRFDFLSRSDMRLVVSYRNIPDSVVSEFHHQVRIGETDPDRKLEWLETSGMAFARMTVRHHNSWVGFPNLLFVRYEDLLASTQAEIARIAAHLDLPDDPALVAHVAQKTSVHREKNEEPKEGQHIRTAGHSVAARELPSDILARLQEIEKSVLISEELTPTDGKRHPISTRTRTKND